MAARHDGVDLPKKPAGVRGGSGRPIESARLPGADRPISVAVPPDQIDEFLRRRKAAQEAAPVKTIVNDFTGKK